MMMDRDYPGRMARTVFPLPIFFPVGRPSRCPASHDRRGKEHRPGLCGQGQGNEQQPRR